MNLNKVDLNKIVIFTQVAEAGSYQKASDILNVTPSAISQSLTILETSLGFKLFQRVGRRLVLTEKGRTLKTQFSQIHQSILKNLADLTNKKDQPNGLIRIGSYFEFAKYQLAAPIANFQKNYPDVQLKYVFDNPSRLHRLLADRKLDLCFSIYPERESHVVVSEPFYHEELVLAAPKGLLEKYPTASEILSLNLIDYYQNLQPFRRWLYLHYKKKPKHLNVKTFAANAEMVLALIEEGLGIGVVPRFLLERKIQTTNAKIEICRPTTKKLMDHIWMLQLKNHVPSPAHQALVKSLIPQFNNRRTK